MATYVMSDIHGLWDKFEKMMDLLNLKIMIKYISLVM